MCNQLHLMGKKKITVIKKPILSVYIHTVGKRLAVYSSLE